MNIARSGTQCEQWTPAPNFALDRFPGILHPALHGHGDRSIDTQASRTGGNIGIKGGVRRQPHAHIARPGADSPRASLRSFRRNIAAAGVSVKCSLYAARRNISRTGVQIDISSCRFLQFDVTAARASSHRSRDVASPHIARTSLQTNFPCKTREFYVSGTALQIDVAAGSFNNLISGAATCADLGVGRDGDFVIYRNVESPLRTIMSPEWVSTSRSTGPVT